MTIIRNVQLGCETVPVLRDTRPRENETNRARDNTITPVLYISKRKKNTTVPVPYLIHHFFRSHLRSHHSRSLFAPFTGSDFPPTSRQVGGEGCPISCSPSFSHGDKNQATSRATHICPLRKTLGIFSCLEAEDIRRHHGRPTSSHACDPVPHRRRRKHVRRLLCQFAALRKQLHVPNFWDENTMAVRLGSLPSFWTYATRE